MNTFIFSIFQEETFGVFLVLIPSQILLYNQIFLLSDGRSLALLYVKTPWLKSILRFYREEKEKSGFKKFIQ